MSSALTIAVDLPRCTYQRSRSVWKVMVISVSLMAGQYGGMVLGRHRRTIQPTPDLAPDALRSENSTVSANTGILFSRSDHENSCSDRGCRGPRRSCGVSQSSEH